MEAPFNLVPVQTNVQMLIVIRIGNKKVLINVLQHTLRFLENKNSSQSTNNRSYPFRNLSYPETSSMLGDVMIWICHQLLMIEAVPIKTKKKLYQWESGLLMNVQKAFSFLLLKIKFLILVHLMSLDAK